MNALVCKVCGHIALSGDAPENCPVCFSPKTAFEDKADVIKTPENPAEMTEGEKKHTPNLTIVKECGLIPGVCQDVHAKMGEIIHPMTPEHSITWIDFYVDKVFVSRITLTPDKCQPAGALHLNQGGGKLSVISNCNVHGSWLAEADL